MHERDMFELIASGAYTAIETVFNTTQSPILRQRSLEGFQQYATVASYYGLQDHFDRLLLLLCRQFVVLARDQHALLQAGRLAELHDEEREDRRRSDLA